MASADPSARGGGLRAGGIPIVGQLLTTDRAVGLIVLGSLVLMVILRRGFSGVLGD